MAVRKGGIDKTDQKYLLLSLSGSIAKYSVMPAVITKPGILLSIGCKRGILYDLTDWLRIYRGAYIVHQPSAKLRDDSIWSNLMTYFIGE